MKKIVLFVIGAIFVCLCGLRLLGTSAPQGASPDQAGAWTSLGPYGGDIVGLARNPKSPSELYAASSSYPSQIFRSVNNGSSWTRQSVVSQRIYDIAVDPVTPSTIYLISYGYLHKSTDKGKNFTNHQFPSGFNADYGRIAVHPTNPNIIIIAGIYYYDNVNYKTDIAVVMTTNGGASWTLKRFSNSADYGYGYDIVFAKSNPNYVYLCGYDQKNSVDTARVYVSKNGGGSWKSVAVAAIFNGDYPASYAIQVDPRDPKKAWVSHYNGIARTANAGSSWKAQQTPQITSVTSIAADTSNPKILYAGGKLNYTRNALKSTDGGVTWKVTGDGVYGGSHRILASGSKVHIATEAGIFLSKNGGVAWNPGHGGIRGANIKAFAASPSSPNTIYAGIYGYALLKTTNGGSAWTTCGAFYGSDLVGSVAVHPTNPNTIYVKPSG